MTSSSSSGFDSDSQSRSRQRPTVDERPQPTRRRLLAAAGAVSLTALAGCIFGGNDEDYYDGETFVDEDDEPEYDGFLEGIDHPGTVDWTETPDEEMVIYVGTGLEGMGYAPRSVRVPVGATVTWEWTGDGGRHDVVDTDDAFDSGEKHSEGETFEFTLEEPGTYTYYCTPHHHRGMVGALEVV
ncbi:plastocyanin/azurin family copper-binding protein [Natronosalvus vescus]|uniref:plastocyanin/azurin family copper-binding protein n=1 Tax=Natronosalvus vescus TaxID=2953881 RepID=UPI002091582F|nr:plastocyanin/azurin family copper-binding protein [Natronosalvus vescus]